MAELLVKDLREQMATIATEACSKLNEVTDETPEERAAEIEREFDAMMSDHDKLQARIQREEYAAIALAAIEEPVTAKLLVQERRTAPAVDNGLQMDFRHAFAEMVRIGGDVYVDQEVRNVLKEYHVQFCGTNTFGRFTVPTTLANFIVESMKAHGPMYASDLFNVINDMSGNTFNIPTVDDTAVTAEVHTEGTQPTDDGGKDATFAQKTPGAFAFNTEWVLWSAELNTNSVLNMDSFLGHLLGECMAWIVNSKLTTGSRSSDLRAL